MKLLNLASILPLALAKPKNPCLALKEDASNSKNFGPCLLSLYDDIKMIQKGKFPPKMKDKITLLSEKLIEPEIVTKYHLIFDCGSSGTRATLYKTVQEGTGKNKEIVSLKVVENPTTQEEISFEIKEHSDTKYHLGIHDLNDEDTMNQLKIVTDNIFNMANSANIPDMDLNKENIRTKILATGGMRTLEKNDQIAKMERISNFMGSTFENLTVKKSKVITGVDEGEFAYLSANYLKSKDEKFNGPDEPKNYGIFEMGGSSIQFATNDYVNSWNGLGANVVRERYVDFMFIDVEPLENDRMIDPCLNEGIELEPGMVGVKSKNRFKDCYNKLAHSSTPVYDCFNHFADIDLRCDSPDSLKKVGQVVSESYLKSQEIQKAFGLSAIFYAAENMNLDHTNFSLNNFKQQTKAFCQFDKDTLYQQFAGYKGNNDEYLKSQCFRSVYILVLLEQGFGIDLNNGSFELVPADEIGGDKTAWAMGAVLDGFE